METNAKRAWAINAMLLGALALAAMLKLGPSVASAEGSGAPNGGVIANVGDPNEKLVVVNTAEKKIMVYKVEGLGQFRLISARTYEFDQQFVDTSGRPDIEKNNGATVQNAVDIYADMHSDKKPK